MLKPLFFNVLRSALGRYDSSTDTSTADYVIGHSFGTEIGEQSVNRRLADYIIRIANSKPVVVDRTLANAFPDDVSVNLSHIVEGPVSDTVGNGVGTWGTLIEAKDYAINNNLREAIMVGQAHHIGRIALQAQRLGLDYKLPADLPNQFEKDSRQRWTRSLGYWVLREALGSVVLKLQKKL